MSRRLILVMFASFFIFVSCAATRQWKREEAVTLVLHDRTKIACQILDIGKNKITFRALNREVGYKYGESIPIYWVRYIELADGSRLSVEEYVKFAKEGGGRAIREAEAEKEEIKQAQREAQVPVTKEVPEKAPVEATDAVYQELANLVVEAGSGGALLLAYDEKRQALSEHQRKFLEAIANSPRWQEKKEDILYLSRLAKRSLYRVYLYAPQDLQEKLDLSFNPDEDMNFLDLMRQLHNKLGEKMKMSEFRTIVEVVGEDGAKALREILANYSDWLYIVRSGEWKEGSRL